MRLERLAIGGFGRLPAGLELSLAPGLNLVLAANERGKTTLSEFIVGLFYGFGPRKDGVHPYQPWAGGESTGGEAAYALADGRRFTLRRHLGKGPEQLFLLDEQGRRLDLAGVQPGELHLGLGQGAFLTVSRIRLEDLQQAVYAAGGETKELKATRQWLAGYFFLEAATRGQVANPVSVRQAWQQEREGLYSPDRRKGKAGAALTEQVKAARDALAQAQAREEQARQLEAQGRDLAGQQAQLEAQREAARQDLQAARQAQEQAQGLARRDQLAADIAALEQQGLATEAAELKARELERESAAADGRAAQARQAAAQARKQAQEQIGDREPEALGQELDGLAQRLAELKAQARHLQDQGLRIERRAQALSQQWGLAPAGLANLAADLPYGLQGLRQAAAQSRQEAAQAEQELATLPPPPPSLVWRLGLALIALVGGLKLTIWAAFALMPWWFMALGGVLILGGIGLGVGWLLRHQQAKQIRRQRSDLDARSQRAREQAQAQEAELTARLAPLPPAVQQADPAALAAARAEALGLEQERAAWQQDQQATHDQEARLRASLTFLGLKSGDEPEQMLATARRRTGQAAQALAEAARLDQQAQAEQAKAQELRAELDQHLASLDLPDLPGLAQARERAKRVEQLRAARDELQKSLGPNAGAALDPEAAARRLQECQAREAELSRQIRELVAQQAALVKEIEHLNQAQTAAQAQAALDQLGERQQALAQLHDTLLLAETLLEMAMEEFRLEAQPSLLQKAGQYLALATGGAYDWLGTDLFHAQPNKEPALSARRGPGEAERPAEILSRGTRDQLYLCLRLALAQEMTAGHEPLPLILDDPLVNFDDERLAAALDLLCALAQERQVLLLTCHQHQAELIQGLCDCRMLEID
ncbi:MAG: AAA family ATPase [Thermodesulfobacteriota bacterium]